MAQLPGQLPEHHFGAPLKQLRLQICLPGRSAALIPTPKHAIMQCRAKVCWRALVMSAPSKLWASVYALLKLLQICSTEPYLQTGLDVTHSCSALMLHAVLCRQSVTVCPSYQAKCSRYNFRGKKPVVHNVMHASKQAHCRACKSTELHIVYMQSRHGSMDVLV